MLLIVSVCGIALLHTRARALDTFINTYISLNSYMLSDVC